jgi:serine/threonine protein kinase
MESWLACASEPGGQQSLVVIERIPRAVSDDRLLRRAAFQETHRAASLNHRALVAARDLFERDDGYYVALDFAPGETVEYLWTRFAAAGGPAPLALTARVIAEAAAGLDFARRNDSGTGEPLIHGHLSPKSLLLGYDGKTKVIGHGTSAIHRGIAKARGGIATSNLHYCAPEQFKGAEPDARTDMFALGVILWELLTGRRLYERAGPYEVMHAVCDEDVPKPSSVNRTVPTRLDPIIQRVLAKDPRRRYGDYGEFLVALEGILQLPGVSDQSMRLGGLLESKFPDRARKWNQVQVATDSKNFGRSAELIYELQSGASGNRTDPASDDDVTVVQTVSTDTTQPHASSQVDNDTTTQFRGGSHPAEQDDPEDTLLTEMPDEIWAEQESTRELERRSTETGGVGSRGSDDLDFETAEHVSPSDDSTRPVGNRERRSKKRRGTQLGKPAPSEPYAPDDQINEATRPHNALHQDKGMPRAPVLDGISEAEDVAPEPAFEPQPTPEPTPEPEPSVDQASGDPSAASRPSANKSHQPVHLSANLGAGFDDLDWSDAFAQLDEDDEDDGDDEPYDSPFAIDDILEPPSAQRPSRDERANNSVMEIVRHSDDRTLAVDTLQGLKRFYRDKEAPFSARLGLKNGAISLKEPVDGWLLRKNDGDNRRELPTPDEKLSLKPGDRCQLQKDDVAYRIRVFHPPLPPTRNRPQFTKQTVIVYAIALVLAGAAHGGGLIGVMAVQALGVRMTVSDKPEQEEIFAEGELKDLKKPEKPEPKPEPKPPPPKPKTKPADPTEQKVKIPKTIKKELSKRVKEKVASRSDDSASDTQNTLDMLKSPNPGSGSTVKDVVSNIDAVKKPGGSAGGFKVGGTIDSLKGDKPSMALGGGGKLGKLGGKSVGKDVGKLAGRKKKGKVRGKVTGIKALSKVQGSLSRSAVYKVIDRHSGQLQGCYERRLMANPGLAGKLVYNWTVKTNGRVKSVRERSSTLGDAKVSQCVAGVIKKMKFPRPKGGEVEISYPFMFQQR